MTALLADVRVSVRRLVQRPTFAVAAVLVLGLGIGACAAVLSLARVVVLQPLPYGDPERLVMLWNAADRDGTTWLSAQEVSSYQQDARTLQSVAGYQATSGNLTDQGEPERVFAAQVTPNLFDTLRALPIAGRTLEASDADAGAASPVVIGHGLWQRRFGGDPAVIGRTIQVNGRGHTVVGVMPASFQLPLDYRDGQPTELWTTLVWDRANLGQWGNRSYIGVARLADGRLPAEATSELAVIARRWMRAGFVPDRGDGGLDRTALPVRDFVTSGARGTMALLVTAAVLMLVLASANVAGLVMIGADARRHDMAVRAALGASRLRLVRQLAVEHLMLAAAGGAVGVAVAASVVRAVVALRPLNLPRAGDLTLDWPALGVLAVASAVAGVVCGVWPAFALSSAGAESLAIQTRGGALARPRQRARQALVIFQVGASLVLLLCATLVARTLITLQRVDLGFSPAQVLTGEIQLPSTSYPAPADVVGFFRRVTTSLGDQPGVVAAGAVRVLPLSRTIGDWTIRLEGRPSSPEENPNADFQAVTPGYFAAMQLRLVRGRVLTDADREGALPVVVVNQSMADKYWPGRDALGQRFMMGTDEKPWLTVVGIVADVHHNAVVEGPRPEMYLAHAQLPEHIRSAPRGMALVVRANGDPAALAAVLRATVRDVDPRLPLGAIRTMADVAGAQLANTRFTAALLSAFALLAGVLAVIGLYGAVSLVTDQRAAEIGLRMALGAERASVLRLVLQEGLVLTAVGVVLGVAASAALARAIEGQLYGVTPHDPATFVLVPLAFCAVALVASFVPARRASRLDPLVTLRR